MPEEEKEARLKGLGSIGILGSPVVPFCPFWYGISLLKPNSRKKGALIIKGLLENQGEIAVIAGYCNMHLQCRRFVSRRVTLNLNL